MMTTAWRNLRDSRIPWRGTSGRGRRVASWLGRSAGAYLLLFSACSPTEPNELDKLGTVDMTIKNHAFKLWIADEFSEQQKGLMFVTAEQMAPLPDGSDRGMIFVFERDQRSSFWMRNTIIPLDIAYVDVNGVIVGMHTMAPFDERYNAYPPDSDYRYAIEVNANRWSQLGVAKGDRLTIPPSLLKPRR